MSFKFCYLFSKDASNRNWMGCWDNLSKRPITGKNSQIKFLCHNWGPFALLSLLSIISCSLSPSLACFSFFHLLPFFSSLIDSGPPAPGSPVTSVPPILHRPIQPGRSHYVPSACPGSSAFLAPSSLLCVSDAKASCDLKAEQVMAPTWCNQGPQKPL